MQFSLNWLQEFFDSKLPLEDLEKKLSSSGLEVDAISQKSASFEGVVVAHVKEVKSHPNADKLCIATVDDGQNELQIVCGAKNCRQGLITALAPVGSTLIDSSGKKHKLKASELRGVQSNGMLLSAEELGLDEESEGIIELSTDYKVGEPLAPHFEDQLLEISFTPNLGHAMSHLGIAREASCHLKSPYKLKELTATKKESDAYSVSVDSSQACPVYGSMLIKGVEVKESPLWLKNRLASCGLKSINHVVDVTNYVLYELGQPLHAFDADRVEGSHVKVAQSLQSESFTTLDQKERQVPQNTLLIYDEKKPIAIAGIMGGLNSQVTEKTQNILLEAANFDPTLIRKASKELNLYTDASKHFERKVDPNLVSLALERAASIICEISNSAQACDIQLVQKTFEPKKLSLRASSVNRILGTTLNSTEIEKLLDRLEFKTTKNQGETLEVAVPTYRHDINLEIDLIEEVARVIGLDHLAKGSNQFSPSPIDDCLTYTLENRLHQLMQQEGLQEVISCDLISPQMNALCENELQEIEALSYMSSEQSVLRTSLLGNHLQILKHNQDRQNSDVHLYEIGKVYHQDGECFEENNVLAITLCGRKTPYHWEQKEDELDFFHLKGIIENLTDAFQINDGTFKKCEYKHYHPQRQAEIILKDHPKISFGEIHPAVLRKMGLKKPVFFAQIPLASLLSYSLKPLSLQSISPFPSSERDWTFTSFDHLEIGHLIDAIKSIPSRLLKDVFLLDLYQSEKIGIDKKNVTLRFVYRNDKKTISFEAVEIEHAKIISEVQEKMKNLILQPS